MQKSHIACRRFVLRGWLSIGLLCGLPGAFAAEKVVLGWLEEVLIMDVGLHLQAKVDTGADDSSVHANNVTVFQRDGNEWVRFSMGIADEDNEVSQVIERPVLRMARVKRKLASDERRPVVALTLCVGNVARQVEVNLAQRQNFKYAMLIGRSYLGGHFLVDPAQTNLTKPVCKPTGGK
ncbi:MAG: ATP-dependent zinc protease [Gammaproteobacteria bacterium]|nr:ATP-dependent zinc protease [Gammaproteobacteria bacterium]MDH5650408.1 ATP-dependent zinc protease [Gammaproteobacteria bacterium]